MRRALAVTLLATSLACAPSALTEVVVVADTDLSVPDELDALRIEVTDARGQTQVASADLREAERPVTLGLVSRSGEGTLDVVVLGEREGVEILRRTARVSFRSGRTLALRMDLWERCVGELCGADRTCGDDGCRSVEIGEDELRDWTGAPPGPPDAATALDGGALDGGALDGGPLDGGALDGGALDAGGARDAGAPRDASQPPADAWAGECLGDAECDDGWTCTLDSCVSGRCVHEPRDEACDDGLDCTTQRCDAFLGCVYQAHDDLCEDGQACTTDVCDPLEGCRSTADHASCGPGSYCAAGAGCTTAPTFTEVYTSIIQVRCGPCHTTAERRGGGLDMASAATARAGLVGVTATCGGGVNTLVVPRQAAQSLLWRKVAGVDLCGSRMPRGSTVPLDASQIALIESWINGGAIE